MDRTELDEGLARAAALFNDGRYHDAHEVLDELWDASSQADSDFLAISAPNPFNAARGRVLVLGARAAGAGEFSR